MKKFICIFVLLLLLLFVSACTGNKGPTKSQIKNDLSAEQDIVFGIGGSDNFLIKDIDIELADAVDGDYEADVVLYLHNDIYTAQKDVKIEYKHYDTGGWKLQDVSVGSAYNIVAHAPHSETAAMRDAIQTYNNVVVEEHQTDLKVGKDVFRFSSTSKGEFFDYTISFEDTYSSLDGPWSRTERKILSVDYNLHQIDGIFYDYSLSSRNFYQAFHFDNISGNTASVSFLYYDTIDEDGYIEKEERTLYFDEDTLTFDMGYYTIAQNKILRDGSELSSYNYYEKQWTREYFWTDCMKFLNMDRQRHTGEYKSDPSSTITEKDTYGIWTGSVSPVGGYWHYNVSSTGVNYGLSSDLPAENQSRDDYGFYGYDPQKQAYIVYYIRNYKIATLEFVKDQTGKVTLKK